jgi:hypothetical protein
MEIRLNAVGRIVNSDRPEHHLRVEDDSDDTGGFFILNWWPGPDEKQALHSFDDWVQSRSDLEQYFANSGWVILWPS